MAKRLKMGWLWKMMNRLDCSEYRNLICSIAMSLFLICLRLPKNVIYRRLKFPAPESNLCIEYSPTSKMSDQAATRDMEGISDSFKSSEKPRGQKQKKIAVLTSGGDSAGMNAAGMFFSAWLS